jgi:hypothetical protein
MNTITNSQRQYLAQFLAGPRSVAGDNDTRRRAMQGKGLIEGFQSEDGRYLFRLTEAGIGEATVAL